MLQPSPKLNLILWYCFADRVLNSWLQTLHLILFCLISDDSEDRSSSYVSISRGTSSSSRASLADQICQKEKLILTWVLRFCFDNSLVPYILLRIILREVHTTDRNVNFGILYIGTPEFNFLSEFLWHLRLVYDVFWEIKAYSLCEFDLVTLL